VPPLLSGEISIFGGIVNLQRSCLRRRFVLTGCSTVRQAQQARQGAARRRRRPRGGNAPGDPIPLDLFYGFLIGSTLAAVSGGLMAPVTALSPTVGDDYLVKAFIIIIIGGLAACRLDRRRLPHRHGRKHRRLRVRPDDRDLIMFCW